MNMSYPVTDSARQNKLLASIPLSHYARMSEHLKAVELVAGEVLFEASEHLDFVYFPTTCTTSLMSHTTDGDSSELAMTGRDGLVGVGLVLGSGSMNHRVVVQCAGQAYRMPADEFQSELLRCRELQQLALCYVQALITQMSQSIVCIGHHTVSERVSFWLLFNQDLVGKDQLKVTHETIANMLGVRRESVTQALGKLQLAGLVASGRGKITIVDRDGLKDGVCECFSLVTQETRRLYARLGTASDLSQDGQGAQDMLLGREFAMLQKYQDAYDFAPVGFVSLDEQGRVVQTNLAGAIMLDIQRSQEQTPEFSDFIASADHASFVAFHQEVLSGKCRRHCELTLLATPHRSAMVIRVDATLNEMGDESRLVMIDVTEEKKLAALALMHERQQQEVLSQQPYMLWFKDQEGRLISSNSTLVDDWSHFTTGAELGNIDLQTLPLPFIGHGYSA